MTKPDLSFMDKLAEMTGYDAVVEDSNDVATPKKCAKQWGVTEQTAGRKLIELAEAGALKRVKVRLASGQIGSGYIAKGNE